MDGAIRLHASVRSVALTCPRCRSALLDDAGSCRCARCDQAYPVVRGVPVLINDQNSVFAVADYLDGSGYEGASYGREADTVAGWRRAARRLARRLGDVRSSINAPTESDIVTHVVRSRRHPRILVIGSGGLGIDDPDCDVVLTDVAFSPNVDVIADAHDLPFPDGSFDLVIAAAVLEHVADPARCVAEMWRVLNQQGFAFAVTPFLQPVHMGAYDFTRFTPIGHRRLFRMFDEVAAGQAMGAASAAAWVVSSAWQGISSRTSWRKLARTAQLLLTWPLRRADHLVPYGADTAAACWFLGRKRDEPITDRELVRSDYRDRFGTSATNVLPALCP